WIPSKNIEKLKNIENIVIYTEKAKTEPPIKLNNPSFARPFEKITKWFGLPTYGNIDPTMFIAIGFPLFFAIMLTDAAYGFILLAISTIIYIKTDNKDIRSLAYILIVSSFATVISGLLFGSIFGEMFGFISVFDTLRDPMTILKISLLIGFLHINFGIALDIYSKIKTHSKGIIEPISWLSLEAGIVMLLLSTATATKYIGYGLIAFTIMIKAKDGFASILSIPSFIGSWISYIRLMALAVATSWLQFVINMGVSAAAKTSITFAMLVFIVGHAFNMALNIVSAFVHAMRLHYVEFFERFYKTGGEEFTPLKNENKYSA
ncbi:MAG: V-type ATPase 116kDa subunit family protein, partial [archaeon]|nr:V-type ATPase 116kDa subunit family protein [archaeon]